MPQAPRRLALATLTLLAAACGQREAAPPAQAQSAETAAPPSLAASATSAAPAAAASVAAATAPAEPLSADPDNPIPLPSLQLRGQGKGASETRYWGFDAEPGTITVSATARNSPSGATQALRFGLYDAKANQLCSDSHGNTTEPKTVEIQCTIDKAMPVLLRLDLSAESLDYAVTLSGPVKLPAAGAATAGAAFEGPASTDIDAPTLLKTNRVKADGPGKPVTYYYAFNAGPGELTLTGDGSNRSAAMTDALVLGVYTLRSEKVCELSLGNTTLDKRVVTTCVFDQRQPVILRADLSAETIAFRGRFEGAYDFEPYTPPKVITIALDSSVMFDTGKSTIKPEARQVLEEAAQRIRKFEGASVLVSGHTDNVGSAASNQKLSAERAAAVQEYLVAQGGVAAGSLRTQGFGASQPVADNGTEAGRARNRRVDVVITPKAAQ